MIVTGDAIVPEEGGNDDDIVDFLLSKEELFVQWRLFVFELLTSSVLALILLGTSALTTGSQIDVAAQLNRCW